MSRAILFELDPERAHDWALRLLDQKPVRRLLGARYARLGAPVEALGHTFANPVGLAAGVDKSGDYIDALGALGFGHIEVGTVTPRPQSGNPKPRLFRLPLHRALINRFGFNNKGVDHLVDRLTVRRYSGILGVNIGKNANTALEDAWSDYQYCLERVYPHADFVTVNISSPNTPGLRDLQQGPQLRELLEAVKNEQSRLAALHSRYVPVAVKIAPDMGDQAIDQFCEVIRQLEIDALIVSNTTFDRSQVSDHLYAQESGGLSGLPLRSLADQRLGDVSERLKGASTTLIGVGGIQSAADAARKRALGASLVQLYTGFIYHGPALVADCIDHLANTAQTAQALQTD